MKKKISLLIPAYNEEESLPALHTSLCKLFDSELTERYDFEALIVNDGSTDATARVLEQLHNSDPRFCYINLTRNFGKENAMLAGFDYVTGDCVVIIDADLQQPVSVVPKMIYWWEQGYDDVYGKRDSRDTDSWLRRKLSNAFYSILQSMSDIDIYPHVGDFRLLDRKCIDAMRQLREKQRYTKGLFSWIGYKKKEVPITYQNREHGESKFKFKQLFKLAWRGITSFSSAPLRFISVFGIIISFIAFVYLIYILVKTIIWGDPVSGFPTLICVILILGGIQLLSIGIIGEYIGQIYYEVKNRPVYLVDTYNGKPVSNQP